MSLQPTHTVYFDIHTKVRTHERYIEAGATLITTNAYGVQPNYYKNAFPDEDWYGKMIRRGFDCRRLLENPDLGLGKVSKSNNPDQ